MIPHQNEEIEQDGIRSSIVCQGVTCLDIIQFAGITAV